MRLDGNYTDPGQIITLPIIIRFTNLISNKNENNLFLFILKLKTKTHDVEFVKI